MPAGYPGDATAQIEAQIERFAPGSCDRILARHVRSVAQMETYNVNYVGGDVVTGSNDALQMVFRPRVALDPYSTGIPGVYICSAATPPGAGAHGMCGYNAALSALRRVSPEGEVGEPYPASAMSADGSRPARCPGRNPAAPQLPPDALACAPTLRDLRDRPETPHRDRPVVAADTLGHVVWPATARRFQTHAR